MNWRDAAYLAIHAALGDVGAGLDSAYKSGLQAGEDAERTDREEATGFASAAAYEEPNPEMEVFKGFASSTGQWVRVGGKWSFLPE